MKYNSLQYLRAVAATGVVLTHASTSLFMQKGALIHFEIGGSGVDLFFIISGFVMYYTTVRDDVSLGSFYMRRVIRIVPIYFILTTLAFLIAVFLPHSTDTFSRNPIDYIRSVLFIPYYNNYLHAMRPELGQGWTLDYEMFFYFVFGLTLMTKARARFYLCLIIFPLLSIAGWCTATHNIIIRTYTDSMTLEFLFGVLIAFFVTKCPHNLPKLLLVMVVLFGITSITAVGWWRYSDLPRFVGFGLPFSIIVGSAILLETNGGIPHSPWLLLAGDASYSLYLTHTFLLAILRRLFSATTDIYLLRTHVLFMVLSAVLSIFASIVFYKTVEAPITRGLMRLLKRHERVPAPAAA